MNLWQRLRSNRRVVVSGVIILTLALIAVFAPLLAPYDPLKTNSRFSYAPPSPQYLMGNDDFGRDILSRLIYGARISLTVAFSAVGIALVVGTCLGMSAAYFGGWVDMLIMRAMDVLLCFPTIILAIAIIAFLGSSLLNLIIAIALLDIPRFARLTYTSALGVKQNQYVEAARAVGASSARIVMRAILPNIIAILFVQTALSLGFAILTESGLSFLGLGVPPPAPTWGSMVSTARKIMDVNPMMVIWPSLALCIAVLSFNTLGNGLRDVLDPRLRKV